MPITPPAYSARYSNGHALVIGIDKYTCVSPLDYAVSDAKGIAEVLIAKFNFSSDRVTVLLDQDASKKNIISAYFQLVTNTSPDDRVIVFFAGHGHTIPGRQRDVGFLVPVDGQIGNPGSLIRWDDLTKNSELIPAKHMIFLMDACYGGLAITRSAPAGSYRFLTDMLRRYGRQVITAGKANEVVADSGGPLPHHSIFTGHLLEALCGKASTPDGILTGSSVMAYVYDRVGKDPQSNQTPHYGFLEGDGDFVFSDLPAAKESPVDSAEALVALPQTSSTTGTDSLYELTQTAKSFLSDKRNTIDLHDLAMTEVRRFLEESGDDFFTADREWNVDVFRATVKRYEDISSRLCSLGICLAHWGKDEHLLTLQKTILRMADRLPHMSSQPGPADFKWYPVILFAYSSGIAAAASDNHESISSILNTKVQGFWIQNKPVSLAYATIRIIAGFSCWFKKFPGHERFYTPLSEYLLKFLQPKIDDLIFTGRQYEEYFDRFEVMLAIFSSWEMLEDVGQIYGAGRYAYKYKHGSRGDNPLGKVLDEARTMKGSWPILRHGLSNISYEQLEGMAQKIEDAAKNFRG